jgi:hypothetical protein
MKLIAAFLVVTPFLVGIAHAEGGDRQDRIRKSIYEVARGDYSQSGGLVEGRAATMSEPHERLGPGGSNDPQYFQQETEAAQ